MNMKALRTAAALGFALGLSAPQVAAQQVAEAEAPEPRQIEVTILGMSCPFCAYGVQQKLKKLQGVETLEVVLDTGIATLTMEGGTDVSNEVLIDTVKEAGFEATMIVRNFESAFPGFMRMGEG